MRRLLTLVVALLTAGCTTTGIINALVPSSGYRVVKDVAYAAGPRHGLDIYVPEPRPANAPVVVFFYGGNWQTGDKAMYLFIGEALAARGFVVIIPDYRLYPEIRFPAFLDDAAQAVRWSRDHAAESGGDPHRIFLMGHSAGAYIAAMLGLDRQYLGAVGLDPARDIAGVVGLAGPYDFLPLTDPALKAIFGPPDTLAQTQPITFADGTAPPMLLLAGTDDDTVDPGNVTRLAARIRGKGGAVTEKFYPGIGHAELVGAMASPLRFLAPVLKDIVAFLDGLAGRP